MQAEFGVIGGTGLYDPKLLKNVQEVTVETPYGKPSDAITVGELGGKIRGVSAKTWEKTHHTPNRHQRASQHFRPQKTRRKTDFGTFNGWFTARRISSRRNRFRRPIHRPNHTARTILLHISGRKGLPHIRC